jgi:hypothetical protein
VLCIPLLAKMGEEAQEKNTGEEIIKRHKKRDKIIII